jgi:hypothetical protein
MSVFAQSSKSGVQSRRHGMECHLIYSIAWDIFSRNPC